MLDITKPLIDADERIKLQLSGETPPSQFNEDFVFSPAPDLELSLPDNANSNPRRHAGIRSKDSDETLLGSRTGELQRSGSEAIAGGSPRKLRRVQEDQTESDDEGIHSWERRRRIRREISWFQAIDWNV